MSRLASLCLFFAVSVGFAAPALTVSVLLAPYERIVREIGGASVEVVTLVPKNANPHTFEPKPDILKRFSGVSLYFSDGSGLDNAWRPRFLGVNPNVQVVDVSEGVSFIAEEHSHASEHGAEHDEELDPHLWNSPRVAMLLASNICRALAAADAPHAELYRENLERFSKKLADLDARLAASLKELPEERRTFIVFHPSYGYLARDYGLKQIAVEMDGKEPKPRDMRNLVTVAKRNRVKTVFVQPQFSRRAAESLSREIGAKIVSIDPLAYDFDGELQKFLDALLEVRK